MPAVASIVRPRPYRLIDLAEGRPWLPKTQPATWSVTIRRG